MRALIFGLTICTLLAAQPYAHGSSLNTLYQFQGGVDGSRPSGGLLHLEDGRFVGTTLYGGAYSRGTVFTLTPPAAQSAAWTKQTIYSFSSADGEQPGGGLVLDGTGKIYGTTSLGGSYGGGTVFQLDPTGKAGDWAQTTLWNFGNARDGRTPISSLVLSQDGSLYGASSGGGNNSYGTLFKISLSIPGKPVETVLWSFTGQSDGKYPSALVHDQYGVLYGSAAQGGTFASGEIFGFDPSSSSAPSVLWAFHGTSDGAYPIGLVSDHLGGLYATSALGPGLNSNGSVSKLSNVSGKWLLTNLLTLAGGVNGAIPTALAAKSSKVLVGISALGGANTCETGHIPVACGTAYLLVPQSGHGPTMKEKVLWDFAPPPSPSAPSGTLFDLGNNAYLGETLYGGAAGGGTIFSLVD